VTGVQTCALPILRVTGPFFNEIPNDMIVRKMLKHDYGSALEHVYFTFKLKDISVALSRELLEHRMASHTAKSTRYVSQAKGLPFYMPPQIDGKLREKVENHIEATWELYKQLEKDIDRESARYILPMGLKCTYVWTINCRSLLNFLRLRLCINAAPEMQELARKVKAIVIKQYPIIFENVDCRGQQWGVCPEPYKRSCHKYPTKKELEVTEEGNC